MKYALRYCNFYIRNNLKKGALCCGKNPAALFDTVDEARDYAVIAKAQLGSVYANDPIKIVEVTLKETIDKIGKAVEEI